MDDYVYKKTAVFQESSLDSFLLRWAMHREFSELKKSSELLLLSLIFYTEFTVEMAPKTKPVVSSSSAVAPEAQMGGSSMQKAPISGENHLNWFSPLRAWRVILTLNSLLNWTANATFTPVFDIQTRLLHWLVRCGFDDLCVFASLSLVCLFVERGLRWALHLIPTLREFF